MGQSYTEVELEMAEEYFAAGGKIHIQRTPTTLWSPWTIRRDDPRDTVPIRSVGHALALWRQSGERGNASLFIDARDEHPANPIRNLA